MRPTRTVPPLLVALLLCGCGGKPSTDPTNDKDKDGGKSGTPAATPVDVAAAKKFAGDFLAAVRDRKAKPDHLTADFKKVFAPPAFDADKAQGYSDAAAALELGLLATEVGADDVTAAGGPDGSAFAVGKGKTGGRTLLRVVKVGGDFKVDWLSVGVKGVTDATLSGGDAPAQFAAQALIDAVQRRKWTHAAALLTEAARGKYGQSQIDKKFDPGALKNSLDGFFGGADKFTMANTSGGAVTVELQTAGGKKTATLKTAKGGRPGEWLVDAIEVK
jgi:hypothetical protein